MRACASSRPATRCPSPGIRRWAPRTCAARWASGGDRLTLEMPAGHHSGARERRSLDAAGERADLAGGGRSRASRWPRCSGWTSEDIGERPLWVNVGTEQLIVPLTQRGGRAARARARATCWRSLPARRGKAWRTCLRPLGSGPAGALLLSPGHAACWRIRRPARRRRTSAAGAWRWGARCRASLRSRRASIRRPSLVAAPARGCRAADPCQRRSPRTRPRQRQPVAGRRCACTTSRRCPSIATEPSSTGRRVSTPPSHPCAGLRDSAGRAIRCWLSLRAMRPRNRQIPGHALSGTARRGTPATGA